MSERSRRQRERHLSGSLIVTVVGDIETALAVLKTEATPVLRELRRHEAYASPSERRRFKVRRANSRRRRRG